LNGQDIKEEILRGGKYAGTDAGLLERICADMLSRYPNRKDAVKAVKRELHSIQGVFADNNGHARAEALINGYAGADMASDRGFALQLMGLHSSTRERIAEAESVFEFLGGIVSQGDAIVDVGCGYNLFSFPFLKTKPLTYEGFDADGRAVGVVNKYCEAAGLAYRARTLDAVTQRPDGECCVLFMFKMIPLLERQRKGRAYELLSEITYRAAVVSFPTRSVSGRRKGMETFYPPLFEKSLPPGLKISDRKDFTNEIFFILYPSQRRACPL